MAIFTLKELPYEYNALSPYISEDTMRTHHSKHHQAYCDKLNAALEAAEIESNDLKDILKDVANNPAIRNNGGGFWNHEFFWETMSNENNDINEFPELLEKINLSFGSFEEFKTQFSNAAVGVFGSGWAWLGVNEEGKLIIYTTPNQDNFMMNVCPNTEKPILGLDVWEHAYYLDVQNRRPEYISNFFKVINWSKVYDRLDE